MRIHSDILIIGSGIAGLSCALKLADQFSVSLITKKEVMEANTRYAQGGIASVMSQTDDFESHIKDTLTAGAGLCHEEIVQQTIRQGPRLIQELIQLGVQFSKDRLAQYDLGREGGHSQRRVLHAGDMTGDALERVLIERTHQNPNIKIFEHHAAIDLIHSDQEKCHGAYVLDISKNEIHTFESSITILGTGGAGKVYLYTSNPDIATGDGMAIAYRAGAAMMNLEFVQFHPTCLYNPSAQGSDKNFLISEAMRGEGAKLILKNGDSFMDQYSEQAELAPRDVVARAIDDQMKKRGDNYVLLDISHRDSKFIKDRFPNIYEFCSKAGIDITEKPIPVVPAAHYFVGGIKCGLNGQTNINGLYAIGETASTGLHGANRLASNSLLEALAMSDLCASSIKKNFTKSATPQVHVPDWNPGDAKDSQEAVIISQNWDEIRRLMWNYVGIVRSDKRLKQAQKRMKLLQEDINEYYWSFTITRDLIELRNVALVSDLIIQCALRRKESRGLHYNKDHPNMSDERKGTLI